MNISTVIICRPNDTLTLANEGAGIIILYIDDDWDRQGLESLSTQYGALILGLQTDPSYSFDKYTNEVINCVIECQKYEVATVIEAIRSSATYPGLIGFDFNDILYFFSRNKKVSFLCSPPFDAVDNQSKPFEQNVQEFMQKVPNNLTSLWLIFLGRDDWAMEEFSYVFGETYEKSAEGVELEQMGNYFICAPCYQQHRQLAVFYGLT